MRDCVVGGVGHGARSDVGEECGGHIGGDVGGDTGPVCLGDSHHHYRAEKNVRCRKQRGDKCTVSQARHVGRHLHLVLHKAGACAERGEAYVVFLRQLRQQVVGRRLARSLH